MARYIGPDCRICRRHGEKLMLKGARCFSHKCAFERRPKAPGQQGAQRRRRLSDRGLQLREKQKARHMYGTLERQFKKTFRLAEKKAGITGDTLLVLLERRLDNVVYRLGFADSRAQARQLVRHGHILLNGRRTDIPSALVKEGDTITWHEGSRRTKYYEQIAPSIEARQVPNWLSLDRQTLTGKVISLPTPDQVGASFDTKLIIEYYSR